MIGTRLRRLRVAKGLTQKQLAEPKYTHAYVSSIEADRRRPSREALEHFAGKLGIDVEELVTGRPADLETRLRLRLAEARVTLSEGRLEEAASAYSAVVRDAKRYRLPELEASAEVGLGIGIERRGEPERALDRFQRAEELLRSSPPTARVEAVGGKGRCFFALGDVRYEIHLLETLLGEIQREGLADPHALSYVHANLVFAYVEAGLYGNAADSAAELDSLAPRLSDPARIALMNINVARLYLVQGDTARAERSLARAEDAYRVLDLKNETGATHLARGYVLSRAGEWADASRELRSALSIFEQTADEKDLTRTLNELGRVERLQGHADAARSFLERSIALMGTSDAPVVAQAHRELGLVLSDLDPSSAEKHFRIAVEVFELSEQTVDLAMTYRGLGDLLGARGEGEAACEAYRTGIVSLETFH